VEMRFLKHSVKSLFEYVLISVRSRFLDKADQKLYLAKDNGRNRVE